MSRIIVRIELHGASEAVYVLLHRTMANAGYFQQILAESGVYYNLPTATYTQNFAEDFSAVQVRDHVKGIADNVWVASSVLVTKYVEAAWIGLSALASKAA